MDYFAPEAKILVVDDYGMNLRVFKNLLKQTKIQVYVATGGEECIDILKRQTVDLIFLDHMMPGMDGVETLHVIRRNKLCEGIPIIMLTANAIPGDKEKYISEGFDDFLSKPIIPDELNQIILTHLPGEYITTENTKKMEDDSPEKVFDQLRKSLPEIDFETGLIMASGDEDFYLELLYDFVHLPIREELEKYLREKDNRSYCIRIHGFKSSAYSMGAKELGDLANEMEQMSQDGFLEEIREKQKRFFEQYDKICVAFSSHMSYNENQR